MPLPKSLLKTAEKVPLDAPLRVPFVTYPCVLHKTHAPTPVSCELHHVLPIYLQMRVWGATRNKMRVPTCGTGHSDVHFCLDAILAGRPIPKGVGITERLLAKEAIRLYEEAKA